MKANRILTRIVSLLVVLTMLIPTFAFAAAADGSIDDVVDAAELRQRICAAVYMLLMKNEGTPARKHCNLPL